jgi:hypothetical protein
MRPTLDHPLAAVMMVLVLVLAGCSMPTTSTDASPTRTAPTASAASTTTPSPPPGISTDGIEDLPALIGAHTDALRGTTFTVRTQTVQTAVESNYTIVVEQTGRYNATAPLRGQTTLESTVRGDLPETAVSPPARRRAYRIGERAAVRTTRNGTVTTRRVAPYDSPVKLSGAMARATLRTLSERNATTVEQVRANGTVLYRVQAQLPPSQFRRNASLEALVTESGLVTEVMTRRTLEFRSGTTRIERTVKYADVGETTVRTPAWFTERPNGTATPDGDVRTGTPDTAERHAGRVTQNQGASPRL